MVQAGLVLEGGGMKVNYVSKEYKQNRKCKTSKYVSVYMDVEDFEKG